MKRAWLALVIATSASAGCSTPPDQGVVMGCFGVVNQNVPGSGRFPNQVVTNLYFGGCSPADNTGMQLVERVTPSAAADPDAMAQICNTDCAGRIAAYEGRAPGTATGDVAAPVPDLVRFALRWHLGGREHVVAVRQIAGEFQAGRPRRPTVSP